MSGTAGRAGPEGLIDLGERLRSERQRQGMTLRELARRVGVSASLVSQIERDLVRPSVGTLYQIVSELGGSLDRLLFDESGADSNGHAAAHLAGHPADEPVQRAKNRKVVMLHSGVRWERLTSEPVPGIDFLYVVYEPGGESAPAGQVQRHSGREWGHVLAGTLHVTIGEDEHVLRAGDSITFDSTEPHRLWNPGSKPVRGIWFVLGRHDDHR